MKNIEIAGSGYAVPGRCITNHDLEKTVDTSDEWITARTGISTRYVSETENTVSLGCRAAVNAIANAGITPADIDLIIVATMTGDNLTPSTACLIQEKLGINSRHVMAFDINAACSGFIYAMHIASAMLGQYRCALVIGAETLSKIIDWTDRNTCVLFGDGAGAVIMRPGEKSHMAFYADSAGDSSGTLQATGPMLHPALENCQRTFGYLHMDGKEVFRFAVKAIEDSIHHVLEGTGVTPEEIDLIIPHQANIRIISYVARKMGLPMEKFFINLDTFGNTSAASIAIAFAQAQQQGLIRPGMKIVLVGFGAGFTNGAVYIRM